MSSRLKSSLLCLCVGGGKNILDCFAFFPPLSLPTLPPQIPPNQYTAQRSCVALPCGQVASQFPDL